LALPIVTPAISPRATIIIEVFFMLISLCCC
jgi:hypothetical protein